MTLILCSVSNTILLMVESERFKATKILFSPSASIKEIKKKIFKTGLLKLVILRKKKKMMFPPTATRSPQESGGVSWADCSNDLLALGDILRGVQLCSPYPANIKEWKIKHSGGLQKLLVLP